MNITSQRTPMVCVLAGALALIVALLVLVPKAASAAPPEPVTFPPWSWAKNTAGSPCSTR